MDRKTLSPEARRLPLDSEILSAVRERRLGVSAIAVLLCLRSHMNAKANRFTCWPSQMTISEELKLSERQARRILRNLEVAGLIRIEKRKQGNRTGSNNLHQYSFVQWWSNLGSRPDICDKQTGHLRQAGRTSVSAPDRTSMSLQNNIIRKTEVKKKKESSPPTPQGAEAEDESLSGSKPKDTVQAEMETESSRSASLSCKEQLSEIKSKMIELKNGREFDCLPPKEKVELADLGIKFLSVKNNDPELVDDLEEYITERMEKVDPYRLRPVMHPPAYRATLKYNFIKAEVEKKGEKDKKQLTESDFEKWRSSRDELLSAVKIIHINNKI